MALNVGARSIGLSRFLLQSCRPAAIASLGTTRADSENGTVQTASGLGGSAVANCQQLRLGHDVTSSSSCSSLPACRLPASNSVKLPGGICGAHFRTFGESAAAAKRQEEAGDLEEEQAGSSNRALGKKDGLSRKPLWRPSVWREEKVLRGELLRSLREWPPDADLNEKLPDGTFGGKPIGVQTLRAVLFRLAIYSLANSGRDKSTAVLEEAKQEASRAPWESTYWCSLEDALQALNAFEWWQSRTREDPSNSLDMFFHPVLLALSGARLKDAISRLWDR